MNVEAKRGPERIDLPRILDAVPNYQQFMTGKELVDSSWQLLEDHPDMVANGTLGYEMLGKSTEGRNIELLRVGKGKKKMLWVGTPHPNEPVGTLASDFMSRYLCENPEVLNAMDATVLFIKNADPDGLELNNSWLKEPMDPLNYALGFYRPPGNEQVEWGFPIKYKTLDFTDSDSPKESQAVMRALHKYEPGFLYSLHNSAFGNAYYYLSPKIDALFSPLQANVTNNGISLLTDDKAEQPYDEKWTDGIFKMVTVKAAYDYYEENLYGDPADKISYGATMSEYLKTISPDHIALLSETPYFTADALQDDRPSDISLKDAKIQGVEKSGQLVAYAKEKLKQLGMLPDSRIKRGIEGLLPVLTNYLATKRVDVQNNEEEYDRSATNAEVYKENQVNGYYILLQIGQVYRLAVESGNISQAEEIKEYIADEIDAINAVSQINVTPIQDLVKAQVGAGLLAMQHVD